MLTRAHDGIGPAACVPGPTRAEPSLRVASSEYVPLCNSGYSARPSPHSTTEYCQYQASGYRYSDSGADTTYYRYL